MIYVYTCISSIASLSQIISSPAVSATEWEYLVTELCVVMNMQPFNVN